MQEPASTIFSALNGLSHIAMLRYFRAHVPSDAPMYYLWHIYALVYLFCDNSFCIGFCQHCIIISISFVEIALQRIKC